MSVVNWKDLKHIHVIRKLEAVLAQWFHTDIFFVDERGELQNVDINDRHREFKNPLSQWIFSKDKSRSDFVQWIKAANEKAYQTRDPHVVVPGMLGSENVVVSKVHQDQDFFGAVVGYCYFDKEITPDFIKKGKEKALAAGWDADEVEHVFSKLKPFNDADKRYFKELVDLVAQEIVTFHTEITKREEKIHALNSQLSTRHSYDSMIGKSKPMQSLYGLLDKIKNSESTVLIQGENGTGKELIARAVHFNSPRKTGQFVTVNCSAFNENLLDSELFGHVRGSFTGAVKDKKGLFESADKGTLFLDEVGDMSPSMQVKLLRVLQEGTLMPVGGTDLRNVDVRVVAATNRDLKEMVEQGTFREDLYYRINVINVVVPPLRERKDDVTILVDHFVARGCKEKNLPMKTFTKRAMEKVLDYPWPGNVRELENEIERVIVLSGDESKVGPELLSSRVREFGETAKVQGVRVAGKLKDALEELEKTMIREGLRRTNWNKSRLAKELGISRAGLIMKVEKYGLDKRKLARLAAAAAGGAPVDFADESGDFDGGDETA